MVTNPLISIIIPAYNAATRIQKCLASIQNQTRQDYEVWVIDDGSVDQTKQRIKSAIGKDDRFHYFYQKNAGVSAARNKGLAMAKGKWIMFVDADDYLESDCLAIMTQQITVERPQLVIAGFHYHGQAPHIKAEMKVIDKLSKIGNFLTQDQWTTFLSLIGPCGKLFLRSLIEQNHLQFDSRFSIGEDTAFVLDYYCHVQKLISHRDQLYVYWRSTGSLSSFASRDLSELVAARSFVLKKQQQFVETFFLPTDQTSYLSAAAVDSLKIIILNAGYGNLTVTEIKKLITDYSREIAKLPLTITISSLQGGIDRVLGFLLKNRLTAILALVVLLIQRRHGQSDN